MISNTNNEWTVRSKNSPDSYYVGVRINKGNSVLIGWVKLEIDIKTGQVKIVNRKLTLSSTIVVGR